MRGTADRALVVDDIDESLAQFPVGSTKWRGFVRGDLRAELREELHHLILGCQISYARDVLPNCRVHLPSDSFVVSLDDRAILTSSDAMLQMHRVAVRPSTIRNGPYDFSNRRGAASLHTQFKAIASAYRRFGNNKKVVLFDDMVGRFGITMKYALENLMKYGMRVHEVYCIVSTYPEDNIYGVNLHTCVERWSFSHLLNARDLFWGFLRSGVTVQLDGVEFGFPLTIDLDTMKYRLPFWPEKEVRCGARAALLRIEKKFWHTLRDDIQSDIRFSDIDRLFGLQRLLNIQSDSIAEFIEEVSGPVERIEDFLELEQLWLDR